MPHSFVIINRGRPQKLSLFEPEDIPVSVGLVVGARAPAVALTRCLDRELARVAAAARSVSPVRRVFVVGVAPFY